MSSVLASRQNSARANPIRPKWQKWKAEQITTLAREIPCGCFRVQDRIDGALAPVHTRAMHKPEARVLTMRAQWLVLLASTLGMLCSAAASHAATVQALVDQFNLPAYQDIISNRLYTHQGMNRGAGIGPQHDLCRDAIFQEFQATGLTPFLDAFIYQDSNNVPRNACNVIVVKPGVQNPNNEVYIVGSHYDSKNNPGADDNATGVACQLEMAKIFSRQYFAKTIVFCAFDAEEIYDFAGAHRLGSVRYVNQHRTDNIRGMISVDMIGWQSSTTLSNTVNIEGRPETMPLQTDLKAAIQSFGGGLLSNLRTPGNYSDHVAFADAGFQACLLIEANWSGNPNYHKLADYSENPGYLNWPYIEKVCKSVIGYYGTVLQPVDVSPILVGVAPRPDGAMQIAFSGLPGCKYATELCTDLGSAIWVAAQTNTADLATGTFQTVDPDAAQRLQCFYRARFVSGYVGTAPAITNYIIDNLAATVVGDWSTNTTSGDKYASDYRFNYAGTGNSYVEYRPNLQVEGNYNVYEWHPQGSNRTTEAPIEITHATGTSLIRINQQANGGTWVFLDTFRFAAGSNGYVRIKNNFTTGIVVMADAMRFSLAP